MRRGPYRFVRHPACAGNLLVALGLGLALANWLSIAALEGALGEPYRAYEAETARLVPGVW